MSGTNNGGRARFAAWGSAAGGYLSMMLGTSAGISELEDFRLGNPNQACNVQAVVSWFGPTNFLKMDELLGESGLLPPPDFCHSEANSPESLFLGQTITEIPEKVKDANPGSLGFAVVPPRYGGCFAQNRDFDPNIWRPPRRFPKSPNPETYIRSNAPPFLLQHGTKDATVSYQLSVELAEKLKLVLGDDIVTLDLFEGAEHADGRFETSENIAKVLDFLDKHLKNT